MKIGVLLSLVAVVLPGFSGCGSAPADLPARSSSESARIQIDRAVRNLGEIALGEHAETFQIRNLGSESLVIRAVQKSCGCVDVRFPDSTIPPGESRNLVASIAPRQPEVRSTSLTLHSNDPMPSTSRIVLSWKATGPITVTPEKLSFDTVRPHMSTTRKIVVKQDLRQQHKKSLTVHGTPAGVFTTRRLFVNRSDFLVEETWEIELASGQDSSLTNGRIVISSPLDPFPAAQIPVTWHVRELIGASPATIFLGTGSPLEHVSRPVEIQSDGDAPLEIDRIEHDGKNILVELETTKSDQNRQRIIVNATLPDRAGSYVEKIRVYCRQPAVTTLEIPLTCVVAGDAVSTK